MTVAVQRTCEIARYFNQTSTGRRLVKSCRDDVILAFGCGKVAGPAREVTEDPVAPLASNPRHRVTEMGLVVLHRNPPLMRS
jgi:hypothetical protein